MTVAVTMLVTVVATVGVTVGDGGGVSEGDGGGDEVNDGGGDGRDGIDSDNGGDGGDDDGGDSGDIIYHVKRHVHHQSTFNFQDADVSSVNTGSDLRLADNMKKRHIPSEIATTM